jgi:tetratricopeptide (TPR) repeat protein
VLDADEALTPQFQTALPQILAVYAGNVLGCVIENHLDQGIEYAGPVQRLFRNLPGVRFTRPYHEYLVGVTGEAETFAELVIFHDGYRQAVQMAKGKPQRGVQIMARYLTEHPEDLYLRVKLAGAYLEAEDLTAATQQCQLALTQLDQGIPAHPLSCYELYLTWGTLHAQQQRWLQAQDALQLALATPVAASFKARAYQYLAQVYVESEDYPAARQTLEAALHPFPDNPDFLWLLAMLYGEAQDYPAARRNLEHLLTLQPDTELAQQCQAYLAQLP